MTSAASEITSHDVVDRAAGLEPGQTLYAVRHARTKVVAATQGSYDLFFAAGSEGLALRERLLVAWYACVLSRAPELAAHYRARLSAEDVTGDVGAALTGDDLARLPAGRLRGLLAFTRKLIRKPIEGNRAEIETLRQAGIETRDIVTLAQLIGFLSYQIRVVAGLKAMRALESQ